MPPLASHLQAKVGSDFFFPAYVVHAWGVCWRRLFIDRIQNGFSRISDVRGGKVQGRTESENFGRRIFVCGMERPHAGAAAPHGGTERAQPRTATPLLGRYDLCRVFFTARSALDGALVGPAGAVTPPDALTAAPRVTAERRARLHGSPTRCTCRAAAKGVHAWELWATFRRACGGEGQRWRGGGRSSRRRTSTTHTLLK